MTGGGVPLNQLNCSTLESLQMPGVYVCGELVDVFGRIGGFSEWGLCLEWAVSGQVAGVRALMQCCTAVGRMPDAVLI